MSKKIVFVMVIALLIVSLGVFADNATVKYGGTVNIGFVTGMQIENYNPFSPNFLYGGRAIYEPMLNFNNETGDVSPWLATSYDWEDNNLKLVFNLRKDVQWSDGVPFTANDVAFTFNLMKKYPALDLSNVWGSGLKSVTAQGSYTVVFDFAKANVPLLYPIGTQLVIPEHIWSTVSDPVTWANTNPIGTGPFLFKNWDSANFIETLVKNPNYWQKGKPYIDGIKIYNYMSNSTADLSIIKGSVDWVDTILPNVEQAFIDKNLEVNKAWITQGAAVYMITNDAKYPFDEANFRLALAMAIDKQKVAEMGEYGFTPPANPTGLRIPLLKSWFDPALEPLVYGYDPQKAIQILKSLGLKQDSSGYFINPSTNSPFSFNLMVVAGWTDWISSAQIIADELKSIGINVNVQQVSYGQYAASLTSGKFDLALGGPGESNVYFEYYSILSSSLTAPIGGSAISNYERWNDPVTDALLNVFASSSSSEIQKRAMAGIELIMLTEVPIIPIFYTPTEELFTTRNFTGWPSELNPYCSNGPWEPMAIEMRVLNIHLK